MLFFRLNIAFCLFANIAFWVLGSVKLGYFFIVLQAICLAGQIITKGRV
ncbi:hypothetical protein JR318_gp035 [Escherichia phage vB_vPM_PD06]|uniref:Uncharacterized protein n=3 Tax=Justusliebigvirus TaxID=2948775 RepID=A0A386KHB0_9CAUD|nr:hypothetical protein JR317_gp204 [Escherichia phage vB_EcoM_PHB05]YP_009984634.1 hypothetical protein JR318_gp035 [Escherichia phage vB_vPM_PD06]YP_009985775.1 hypothetical protein JR322_gp088 [Escherichia phage muut]AXY81572.1 hypothetical protein [Escherichia phage vB_vPM_PD114]QHR67522.1 hypothetical protein arall_78 [Escherichia phage arall]QHR69849.1 hypothetical protein inny_179 [Escherichia phage inny]QHR75450.1 hypothetical protein outra_129 [Escherichia phage outra]QXV78223.1 hyp